MVIRRILQQNAKCFHQPTFLPVYKFPCATYSTFSSPVKMSEDNVSSLVYGLEVSSSRGKSARPRRPRRKHASIAPQSAHITGLDGSLETNNESPQYSKVLTDRYSQEQLEVMPQAKREAIEAKLEAKREKLIQKKKEKRKAKQEAKKKLNLAEAQFNQSASDANSSTSTDTNSDTNSNSKAGLKAATPTEKVSREETKFLRAIPLDVVSKSSTDMRYVNVLHLEPWLARVRSRNGCLRLEELLNREEKRFFAWPPHVVGGHKPNFDDEVNSKFAAIDCEMVETTKSRNYAARVSVVDYHGKVLLDCYVEPDGPVTQWRTRFSGISPQVLQRARKEHNLLKREDVIRILDDFVMEKNLVLVGHNVSCDLKSLQYTLPKSKVLDSQRLNRFKTDCGGNGLKRLIEHYYNMKIQQSKNGHDSVEDSRASMLLFRTFQRQFHEENKLKFEDPFC